MLDALNPVKSPTFCNKPAIFRAANLRGTSGSRYRGMNAWPPWMSGSPQRTATAKTFPAMRCAADTVTPREFDMIISVVYMDNSANTRNVMGPANPMMGAN